MGRSGIDAQVGYAEEAYVNEVQRITITGTPTGGTFTLTFDGATTAAIAFDAAASAVEAALELLPNIDTLTSSGGALPDTAVDITFAGNRVARRNLTAMTADDALLTGGSSPAVAISTITPGTGYGDYATPDRFLEFVSEGFKRQQNYRRSAALRKANTVQRTDRTSIAQVGAAGPVVHELANKGFGRLFGHCIDTGVITTPGGGTLSRDHTFTPGSLYNSSFVTQFAKPDTENTDQPFSYLGCKVADWEISQELDSIAMLTLNLDAFDEVTAQALASASYPSAQELFHDGQLQVTVDGANFAFTSVKCSGTNALKTERRFIRANTRKKQPIKAGMQEFGGELGGEFENLTPYNRFVNGTIVPVVYTWTSATLIEATFPFKLTITMPACRFIGETPNVDDPGVLEQPLQFEALNDGTAAVITLVYRTSDTAA